MWTPMFPTVVSRGAYGGGNAVNSRYSGAKKVFSQPQIVQVLPLKKMGEACNFHHRYTSIEVNLFANDGGK